MTIYQGLTTSFKVDILEGKQNIASDTLKMALYTAYATLDQDTTAYSSANEISGTGYTAGGQTLSNVTINSGSNTVYVSFSNVVWNPAHPSCTSKPRARSHTTALDHSCRRAMLSQQSQ